MKKIKLILPLILLAGLSPVYAQVTIGSELPPAKGALLEIKSEETANPSSVTDSKNVTSTKGGLGLPRVQLSNLVTLEPFIATTDPEWASGSRAETKAKHAGLMVYNIETSSPFSKGIYVWDGNEWSAVSMGLDPANKYFYIPSFNIPLTAVSNTTLTFNLYSEYKKQFTKAGNTSFISNNSALTVIPSSGSRLYAANELDYVITYYDEKVVEITGVSSTGIMTYKVKSLKTTPNSFMNVVFVVKE